MIFLTKCLVFEENRFVFIASSVLRHNHNSHLMEAVVPFKLFKLSKFGVV